MISNLGLLTRRGMELFYPIFKDMENWQTDHYADPFPHIPFDNKPRGDNAAEEYKNMLLKVSGLSSILGVNGGTDCTCRGS